MDKAASVKRIHHGTITKSYVIVGCSAQATRLALDALPSIFLHGYYHIRRELKTTWVTCMYGGGGTHRRRVRGGWYGEESGTEVGKEKKKK